MDKRAGHVPGAVNAPFEQNMVDGRFKSTDDLMAHYESRGVSDAADVVLYCGSGVSACHDLLAMEYSGLGRGRLYVGSWSQWSASDRPAATGPEPG
jgi:thiosulfate/3-mercaptopyruvate sulfurtransferase